MHEGVEESQPPLTSVISLLKSNVSSAAGAVAGAASEAAELRNSTLPIRVAESQARALACDLKGRPNKLQSLINH